jgi:Domain of unknown function (DUF4129)
VRSALESPQARVRARAGGSALAVIALLTATAAAATERPVRESPAGATERPAGTTEAPPAGQPTRAEVAAAVGKLKADPNLGADKQTRKLVRNTQPKPDAPGPPPSWLHWIADAFAWLASTARALLWVAGILLVGILGLYIKRFVESRDERSAPLRFSLPTHVRDLDIRPESLPDDIGRAALELWERAEHRTALALLYRGLLSRLAHVHEVPIRDSSTEGDCLTLAAAHLPATRLAYAGRLIRVWQRAVYGNTEPTSEEFRALCAGFAAAADAPVADATVAEATAERAA